jgi:hypothetical protein
MAVPIPTATTVNPMSIMHPGGQWSHHAVLPQVIVVSRPGDSLNSVVRPRPSGTHRVCIVPLLWGLPVSKMS